MTSLLVIVFRRDLGIRLVLVDLEQVGAAAEADQLAHQLLEVEVVRAFGGQPVAELARGEMRVRRHESINVLQRNRFDADKGFAVAGHGVGEIFAARRLAELVQDSSFHGCVPL